MKRSDSAFYLNVDEYNISLSLKSLFYKQENEVVDEKCKFLIQIYYVEKTGVLNYSNDEIFILGSNYFSDYKGL